MIGRLPGYKSRVAPGIREEILGANAHDNDFRQAGLNC